MNESQLTRTSVSTLDEWLKLLSFVYNNTYSSFYRDHYLKFKFNPDNFKQLDDIHLIPLITKTDLLSASTNQLCFVAESQIRSLSSTSGTTGVPLVTFNAPSHLAEIALRPEHNDFGIGLVLFNPLRAGSLLYSFHKREQAAILGDIHNLPATCAFAANGNVKTITTTPTLAILLKKYIEAQPKLLKNVKYLRLGGETLSPAKKEYLKNLYPGVVIFNAYASSEVGWAASQCIHLAQENRVLYHPNTAGFHLEIIDNELIVTDFSNLGTPLIRYRTGDRAQFIDQTCTCGIPGPLLEIQGRINYDTVRAGGFEIRTDMVEPPLLKLQFLIHYDFEVHIHETYINDKPQLRIVFHFALQEGIADSPETRHYIIQTFNELFKISPTMSLSDAQKSGLIAPLEIEFTTFPKTGKSTARIILH